MKSIIPVLFLFLFHFISLGKKPPNILWIVGENLKLDLGCYGAKNVKTPNLDQLAREGEMYTKVFSTSPVCAPSRSAFFVGMYQTTTDTHNMRSHREDDYRLPEGVRPITHRLKDVGYYTANLKTMNGEEIGSGKLDLNLSTKANFMKEVNGRSLRKISLFLPR